MSNILHEQQLFSLTDLNTIFTHFSPQDIEEFYQLYQLWSLQQKRAEIVAQMQELEQQIIESEARLNAVNPSAIAMAALSQFRAIGVDDIDLLDSMLERGDEWLDHTLQLFEHCERLGMLQGNVNQWCTHALEGAYDWIESMSVINEESESDDDTILSIPVISTDQPLSEVELLPETTETDFLQKLMSEDEEDERAEPVPRTSEEFLVAGEQSVAQEGDRTEPALELDSQYEEIEYAIPSTLPEIQEESEPIETTIQYQTQDLQSTEPEPVLLDPLAQPISFPEQLSHEEQKRANQIRRSLKMYSIKQKKKYRKQRFNQYNRIQKKSR